MTDNKEIEKTIGAIQHTALALELPAKVYDAYTAWLRLSLTQLAEKVKRDTIRDMQHQARNVLKSAEAVAQWGDLYLKTLSTPTNLN